MITRRFPYLLVCLAAATVSHAGSDHIRIVRSGPDGILVEATVPMPEIHSAGAGDEVSVHVPGWDAVSDPGVPAMPRTGFRLALPPDAEPRLIVRILSERFIPSVPPLPVPTPRIDVGADGLPVQVDQYIRNEQAFSSTYPSDWAVIGPVAWLRHHRVIPVEIFPYRWDPAAAGMRVATEMEIEVRFVPAGRGDPGFDGGWNRIPPAPMSSPGPEHDSWERIYGRSILNHSEARSWARSPRLWTSRGPGSKTRSTETGMRIDVERSDIHRVRYEDLVNADWSAFQPAVGELALVERWFVETDPGDPFHEALVPMMTDDADGNGIFGPGDSFYFFGLTSWDRFKPGPERKRYGRRNSYMLFLRPEGGARMEQRTSWLESSGISPETSFVWTDHIEGDGYYMKNAAAEDLASAASLPLGIECIKVDHSLWFGHHAGTHTVNFDLPGVLELLGLEISLQGVTRPPGDFPARVTMRVAPPAGDFVDLPGPYTVGVLRRQLYTAGPEDLASLNVVQSGNRFQMEMPSDGYGAALDWMRWTYSRSFTAVNRRLAWDTNGLPGVREYRLSGFGGTPPLLFDVTDSTKSGSRTGPVRLTYSPDQLQDGTLRLRLDLGGAGGTRSLIAVAPDRASVPSEISPVAGRDLGAPQGAHEDFIIICHDDFLEAVEPLAQARRAQGMSVRKVSIRDVYDQFAGGRRWPDAVRSYLRFLFRTRASAPSFLLLVGDASNDLAGVLAESGPNFVPTQTVFSLAHSGQGPELVSSDTWYVDNLTGAGELLDFHPDMHVGRIPAGTVRELEIMVDKILEYERFRDTDAWRSRGLFIADDEYSGDTGTSAANYTWRGDARNVPRRTGDSVFRWASQESRRLIHEAAGFTEVRLDSFFTATYMDTVACLGRCAKYDSLGSSDCRNWRCRFDDCANTASCYGSPAPYRENYDYGYFILTPLLRDRLNLGHLFVSYQGHANRYLVSHEYIFQDDPFVRQDSRFLNNTSRPFFFLGFSCHLAEFSGHDERGDPNRDCISEKLLFLEDGKGAVASLASTAYEWVSDNHRLNLALFHEWFVDPPRDAEGRSRWLLGELATAGKYRLTEGGSSSNLWGPVATYVLLGDPTMTLEMAPPRIEVLVNGETWVDGTPVEAVPAGDSLFVTARLWDEVSLDATLLRAGVPVPDSLYSLVPDPGFPGSDRRLRLEYRTTLQPPVQDYVFEIRAADRSGRTRSTRLPVRLDTDFMVLRDGVHRTIRAQDTLEPADTVVVAVRSPVNLDPADMDLWLGDGPLAVLEKRPDGPRRWELEAVLPEILTDGEQRLSLRIRRPDGEYAVRTAPFQGGMEENRLLAVYNFPNPFEDRTRIYYRLSRTMTSARVQIFTLGGRRIWSAEGPARVNDNHIEWDGRDSDGDQVANGLYFYKVEVLTDGGRTIGRIERMARIR